MAIKDYEVKRVKIANKIIDGQGKVWTKEAYDHMRKYQTEYNKRRYRMYCVRFFREEDKEVIDYLENLKSFNLYIKSLVKKDLKRKGIIK